MVIRPNGYSIWERIQTELNERIADTGAQNAYFPFLIPESFIKKEAEHVEGFAPELAIVTHAGGKKLDEPLVARPTSETIINSMFAKWIQSYRDLPLMINQWANVIRWEMRTRLFLRTTEFLWQEGHTCHATLDEAETETRQMLKVYQDFCRDILAMPVLSGQKCESEKFAGALRTYSIELMTQDLKALQAGTSHNLSNNFAKAFGTEFLDKDSVKKTVFQTSWGVSTRLIGGLVMAHSDDQGLILPPRVAKTQVVIVPIIPKPEHKARVLETAEKVKESIVSAARASGYPDRVVVKIDSDESKQSGWKFHEYELQGIPVRIEIGPRDVDQNQVVVVRRDLKVKNFVKLDQVAENVVSNLVAMQTDLLKKAEANRDQNTKEIDTLAEFKEKIDQGGFFIAPWDPHSKSEGRVKEETKATCRVLLLDSQFQCIPTTKPCFVTGNRSSNNVLSVWARSY